jgi:hypothetical protein
MKIDYSVVVYVYQTLNTYHRNHSSYETLLSSYECFKDIKWSPNPKKNVPKQRVVKFGNVEATPENMYKKDLISSLNKLTLTNMETIGISILKNFKLEFVDIFVIVMWEYFKRQPVFQEIYIKIIEKVADYSEVRDKWFIIFQSYIKNKEWQMDYTLIEQSHNYNDFCYYIKKKKELNAIAQGWARLMNIGVITADVFEWCFYIIETIHTLDLSHIIYKTMLDSYIEQLYAYCTTIQYPTPLELIEKIEFIKKMPIQKSTQFKIEDFIREKK